MTAILTSGFGPAPRWRAFLLGLLVAACNPASDLLNKARAEAAGGPPAQALQTYRGLVTQYPDAPEVTVGAEEAASLVLAVARVNLASDPKRALDGAKPAYSEWPKPPSAAAERDYLGALTAALNVLTRQLDYERAAEMLDEMRSPPFPASFRAVADGVVASEPPGDGRLSAMIRWRSSTAMNDADRAQLALTLIEEAAGFQGVVQPWLDAHLFAGTTDSCLSPLRSLASTTSLEALDGLEALCGKLERLAPGAAEAAEVEKLISEAIPKRRTAIKASPAYRDEEALRVCVEFQNWNTAIHRSPPRTEAALERVRTEMERRLPAMRRALEYLTARVQYSQDWNFGRRVADACRGR